MRFNAEGAEADAETAERNCLAIFTATQMHISIAKILICSAVLSASALFATAQTATTDNIEKGKYRAIDVQKFEVAPGVDIPSNQINVILLEIVDELYKIKKFDRITKPGSKSAAPDTQPRLRLEGTIAKYFALVPQKYTTEAGDIWTRVKVQVKFVDASDNKILLEKEIDRRVFFGPYQFYFSDVSRKVAKEVAKIAKKTFF